MRSFFEKHETLACILLIVLYLVINSLCLNLFGTASYQTALINTAFSGFIVLLIIYLKRTNYYGLSWVKEIKQYLYFIPLALIVSVNLWGGFSTEYKGFEILYFVITMINVGFLEEVIFRGFLFKMMQKSSLKSAIIVSSITFGIGHIINLFNGAEIIPTLLQICYATSIGFLFVIIFYKSASLLPCIITHSLVNSLSLFSANNLVLQYAGSVFLIIVQIIYSLYLIKNKKLN